MDNYLKNKDQDRRLYLRFHRILRLFSVFCYSGIPKVAETQYHETPGSIEIRRKKRWLVLHFFLT